MNLHSILPQSQYQRYINETSEWVSKAWKASLSQDDLTRLDKFKTAPVLPGMGESTAAYLQEAAQREVFTRTMLRDMVKAQYEGKLAKAGVTTALGYNFYDLRAPVFLLYPVNVPFRNSIQRIGRVNDGYGTAAHWKATRNPGILWAGANEGMRAPTATPDENDYVASYKELGIERGVTFTAQFAGEGFSDNLADEHLRGLHELWLQEEGIILNGNSGSATGNNGFALGTAPTPATAVTTTNTTTALNYVAANAFTTNSYVSAAVVLLTAMGNPTNAQYGYQAAPTLTTGLTPSFQRTNADGSLQTVFGGMSAVSAISNVTQCTGGNLSIKITLPVANLPLKGVYGYAWFVDTELSSTGSLAKAYLAGITSTPYATVSSTATGTQTAAATGLSVDHSYNTAEFDGLLTYSATTAGSYWSDLGANVTLGTGTNLSLTSGKDGSVNEVETALQSIFQNYQTGVDEIWGDVTAILCLHKAIRYSGTQASGFQFITTRDGQNNLLGGFVVSAYQSRFAVASPTGANAIPMRIHPMVPPGTLYFHVKNNPYPHSRLPWVSGMLVQRDYYSIEWPLTTRQWTFGTYVHEVLAHNVPWIPGVITGIGTFVGA